MAKKMEFKFNGETIKWEEKSHAQIFRNFWDLMKETDLEKTIETIDLVGIRTSESELFIAKNGSKKKNIPLIEGERWIYTHLTPKAMEKAYEKFLKGWNGEYVQPQETVTAAEETEETNEPTETVETPQANATEQYDEPLVIKTAEEIGKDELAQEEYGVNFSDLLPSQKGKITKKYNAAQRANIESEESQEETSEESEQQEAQLEA